MHSRRVVLKKMVANFHNKMSALLQPQLRPLSCSVPSDELINSFVPAGNLGLQSYNKFESTFLNLFEAILQAVVIKKQSKVKLVFFPSLLVLIEGNGQ